tara:strand:- start:2 stop:181 length:180 start_codon:yes stop_codon:yes gene_type:complete
MRTILTSKELWKNQAPNLNFEFNEKQILAKALEVGFVTKVGDDQYLVNEKYTEEVNRRM